MDLLRRFHPSREKSPANQLPDKNHGQATLIATAGTDLAFEAFADFSQRKVRAEMGAQFG